MRPSPSYGPTLPEGEALRIPAEGRVLPAPPFPPSWTSAGVMTIVARQAAIGIAHPGRQCVKARQPGTDQPLGGAAGMAAAPE